MVNVVVYYFLSFSFSLQKIFILFQVPPVYLYTIAPLTKLSFSKIDENFVDRSWRHFDCHLHCTWYDIIHPCRPELPILIISVNFGQQLLKLSLTDQVTYRYSFEAPCPL